MEEEHKPIILRFVKPWERARVTKGSECARKIRREIERLSNGKLELKQTHPSVEGGYVPGYRDKGDDLDYEIYCNGNLIAMLDTTCSNYTFKGSRIMPVNFYKGQVVKKSKVPAFLVFSMEKEEKPLKDRCVWIRGEDVINAPNDREELGGKIQHNHYTNKKHWHRGLQNLVDEFLKIAETSKQTTSG